MFPFCLQIILPFADSTKSDKQIQKTSNKAEITPEYKSQRFDNTIARESFQWEDNEDTSSQKIKQNQHNYH